MISANLPENISRTKKWEMVIGLSSLVLIGIGVFLIKAGEFESSVQITNQSGLDAETTGKEQIWVDVEGAVVHPGVYKLDVNSRIDNILERAGGLTDKADREWVDKNVNRAQIIPDGYKLYIPEYNVNTLKLSNYTKNTQVISINSSSQSDLEELPGIGPATAKKIIENRPFTQLEELTEKKIIGQKVWEDIKDQISLW